MASASDPFEPTSCMTAQTIMRPLSPATLEKLYRVSMREDLQRRADEVTATFDLGAMKEAATTVLGHTCNAIYHIAQGGLNQVFILTFEENSHEPIVARLSGTGYHQDDGVEPSIVSYRVASEIATLRFLKESTKVPVAHVFAFATDPDNPVKTRYSLQSQIVGRCLSEVWLDLTIQQMEAVVRGVAHIEGQLWTTTFTSIGSLIIDNKTGAVRVGQVASGRSYTPSINDDNGPWSSSRDFLKALALPEISFLENESDSWLTTRKYCRPEEDADDALRYTSTWYTLLCKTIDSLNFDVFDPPSCPVVLRHDDLHHSNILVAWDDPTRVVGIVDWEGARCVPLWTYMIGDNFLQPNDLKRHSPEALTHLRSIRHAIHVEIQPALSLLDQPFAQALKRICEILTWTSTRRPLSDLESCIQLAIETCPPDQTTAFREIAEFVSKPRGSPALEV